MSITLKVSVNQGKELLNVETKKDRKSDPYCTIEFRGKSFKTKTIENNLDPAWNETFEFKLDKAIDNQSQLALKVFDKEMMKDRPMGEVNIPLGTLLQKGTLLSWYNLTSKKGDASGKVEVNLEYNDPNNPIKPAGGGATAATDANAAATADGGDGSGEAGVQRGSGGADSKGRKRRRLTNLSTKPADYQVRIHIIQGKNLQGSTLDPVVKMRLMNQRQATRVHKSTTNPLFDEHFSMQFTESPAKLFEEQLNIEVFNAKTFKDDLVGAFALPVGMIYEEENHMFPFMWLMLTNPKNGDASCQGYLKVTLTVLGPGDEAVLPDESMDCTDDNIEDKILRPMGGEVELVDVSFKVFLGSDVPQTDASFQTGLKRIDKLTGEDDKENCDPFLKVEFAGKIAITKVIDNCYNPEWNEELHLPIQIPSMLDRVKIQLYDSDTPSGIVKLNLKALKFADDVIATTFMFMNDISSSDLDNGYLPVFGPAYVNFYGAPREFKFITTDYHEDINAGIGEGLSFRGRALLEVTSAPMAPEGMNALKNTQLDSAEKERVEWFKNLEEYMLRVVISDVNMLNPKRFSSGEIQFEVSMGTFGSWEAIEDDEVVPFNSMTLGMKPRSESGNYLSLVYDNKKPCIEMLCQWEKVSFRHLALNAIRAIVRRLEKNIERLDTAIPKKDDLGKPIFIAGVTQSSEILRNMCFEVLDEVIVNCDKPAKPLPEKTTTTLDGRLFDRREQEKMAAMEAAARMKDELINDSTTPETIVAELRVICRRLSEAAVDPQLCIPDIIVWMLHKGERAGSYRFSPLDYMWSADEDERGILFGKFQSVFLRSAKEPPKKLAKDATTGQIQLAISFGPKETVNEWPEVNGTFVALAEVFENQRYIPIKGWSDMMLPIDPPKFSDKSNKIKRGKADFKVPDAWKWNAKAANDPWYLDPDDPELDVFGDQDTVVIEVFENERKQPLKGFCKMLLPTDPPPWSDRSMSEPRLIEDVALPPGWLWTTDWKIDSRGGDKDGWQYALSFRASYHASRKKTDFVRRRRWVIERTIDPNYVPPQGEAAANTTSDKDGWLYGIEFGARLHQINNKLDTVRRRRWHAEITPEDPKAIFLANLKPDAFPSAGTFVAFGSTQKYQLRCHIFQARDLIAEDQNGLSDPFLRVTFSSKSQRGTIVENSITPKWDETIILDDISLYGSETEPEKLLLQLNTRIVVQVFDYDQIGSDDFLGQFVAFPKFRSKEKPEPPVLDWFKVMRGEEDGGEILAAFEIIPYDQRALFPLPRRTLIKEKLTRKKRYVMHLPEDIRPEMQPCTLQILTWGLRDLAKVMFLSVSKPHVEFECGGFIMQTDVIKGYSKLPNFKSKVLTFPIDLPIVEKYAPPLNIRVYDNRKFGARPLVGTFSVKSLNRYKEKLKKATKREGEEASAGVEGLHLEEPATASNVEGSYESAAEGDDVALVKDKPKTEEPKKAETKISIPKLKNPLTSDSSSIKEPEPIEEANIDWWSKFYASCGQAEPGPPYEDDKLFVAKGPLERHYDFEDPIIVFPLSKGKKSTGDFHETGRFKGNFVVRAAGAVGPAAIAPEEPDSDEDKADDKITDEPKEKKKKKLFLTFKKRPASPPHEAPEETWPVNWRYLPDKTAYKMLVRFYAVQCLNLTPKDDNGKSDPYMVITFGKNKPIKDKDNYIARTLNPLFGRMFEMECEFPRDNTLKIQVFDYDMLSFDDLIGETVIDVENRWLSRCRGTIGLAQSYQIDGLNKWRDPQKPSELLDEYCEKRELSKPVYTDDDTTLASPDLNNGKPLVTKDFPYPENPEDRSEEKDAQIKELRKENVALMALHTLGLVVEHVETRTLHDPVQPDMDQGKIQMWVDILPRSLPAPQPVDITPRKPLEYELRVIVWDTTEVIMMDKAFTGEEMTDIYVKCMFRGMEKEKRKTDVHYRSLDGEGNFNWRQKFPFKYIPAEEQIFVERKAHIFSREVEQFKFPPIFAIQIWDNDIFGPDEFVGEIEINLIDLVMPARDAKKCTLKGLQKSGVSLFKKKIVRGWYPVVNGENQEEVTGKVDVEVELLTKKESEDKPNGNGREDPNQYPKLDPPNRPATSFFWFTSPWKTFKHIIWKHYKWYIITALVLILVGLLVFVFIYTAPQSIMTTIVSALKPS